jgi:serpin B
MAATAAGLHLLMGIPSALAQAGDVNMAADALNEFTWRLNARLAETEGNLFYSPFSMHTALEICLSGAGGETRQELQQALQTKIPDEAFHQAFSRLRLTLTRPGLGEGGAILRTADRLWAQKGQAFLPEFRQKLETEMGASLREVDYLGQPEKSRVEINDWISTQTQGTIQHLLPSEAITRETRLLLTNVIYLKAFWEYPFDPDRTKEGEFTPETGKKLKVPFMRQTQVFKWGRIPRGEALEMPYRGTGLSMLILLPAPGQPMKEFFQALDAHSVEEWTEGLEEQKVFVQMPRFEARFRTPLREVLGQLGIRAAFGESADYSGMDGTGSLHLDGAIHEAVVKVTEEGTEAAAVTASGTETARADREQPRNFIIDRPFVLLIRDRISGAVIYVGRIVNPQDK